MLLIFCELVFVRFNSIIVNGDAHIFTSHRHSEICIVLARIISIAVFYKIKLAVSNLHYSYNNNVAHKVLHLSNMQTLQIANICVCLISKIYIIQIIYVCSILKQFQRFQVTKKFANLEFLVSNNDTLVNKSYI